MSNEALTWAFKQPLKTTPKFVLVALADHADERHSCWPTHNRIAEMIGASRSTVRRALGELESLGYIRHERRLGRNGQWTANRYFLEVGPMPENGWPKMNHPLAHSGPPPGSPMDHPLAHSGPPPGSPMNQQEPPLEPPEEPSVEPSPSPPVTKGADRGSPYAEDFLEWWKHYPRKQDKGGAFKAWKKIRDASLEELIAGADRYAADPNRVDQYTKHPATWLNARAWEDEMPLPARQVAHRQMDNNQRMAAAMRQANRGRAALAALAPTEERRQLE